MARWIFRSVILILFSACVTLWVRSYWVSELVHYQSTTQDVLDFRRTIFSVASGEGGICFSQTRQTWNVKDSKQAQRYAADVIGGGFKYARLGAGYAGNVFDQDKHPTTRGFGHAVDEKLAPQGKSVSNSYIFPHAAPTTFFAILPVWWLFRLIFPAPKQRKLVASTEFADNDYLRSPHDPIAPRM
jgi:hypothetical protein